jgi:hypothetical protein
MGPNVRRGCADGTQTGKIEWHNVGVSGVADFGPDLVDRFVRLALIAAGKKDPASSAGKTLCCRKSKTRVATGDQYDATLE